eukprot:scpid35648/ scgid0322/ 
MHRVNPYILPLQHAVPSKKKEKPSTVAATKTTNKQKSKKQLAQEERRRQMEREEIKRELEEQRKLNEEKAEQARKKAEEERERRKEEDRRQMELERAERLERLKRKPSKRTESSAAPGGISHSENDLISATEESESDRAEDDDDEGHEDADEESAGEETSGDERIRTAIAGAGRNRPGKQTNSSVAGAVARVAAAIGQPSTRSSIGQPFALASSQQRKKSSPTAARQGKAIVPHGLHASGAAGVAGVALARKQKTRKIVGSVKGYDGSYSQIQSNQQQFDNDLPPRFHCKRNHHRIPAAMPAYSTHSAASSDGGGGGGGSAPTHHTSTQQRTAAAASAGPRSPRSRPPGYEQADTGTATAAAAAPQSDTASGITGYDDTLSYGDSVAYGDSGAVDCHEHGLDNFQLSALAAQWHSAPKDMLPGWECNPHVQALWPSSLPASKRPQNTSTNAGSSTLTSWPPNTTSASEDLSADGGVPADDNSTRIADACDDETLWDSGPDAIEDDDPLSALLQSSLEPLRQPDISSAQDASRHGDDTATALETLPLAESGDSQNDDTFVNDVQDDLGLLDGGGGEARIHDDRIHDDLTPRQEPAQLLQLAAGTVQEQHSSPSDAIQYNVSMSNKDNAEQQVDKPEVTLLPKKAPIIGRGKARGSIANPARIVGRGRGRGPLRSPLGTGPRMGPVLPPYSLPANSPGMHAPMVGTNFPRLPAGYAALALGTDHLNSFDAMETVLPGNNSGEQSAQYDDAEPGIRLEETGDISVANPSSNSRRNVEVDPVVSLAAMHGDKVVAQSAYDPTLDKVVANGARFCPGDFSRMSDNALFSRDQTVLPAGMMTVSDSNAQQELEEALASRQHAGKASISVGHIADNVNDARHTSMAGASGVKEGATGERPPIDMAGMSVSLKARGAQDGASHQVDRWRAEGASENGDAVEESAVAASNDVELVQRDKIVSGKGSAESVRERKDHTLQAYEASRHAQLSSAQPPHASGSAQEQNQPAAGLDHVHSTPQAGRHTARNNTVPSTGTFSQPAQESLPTVSTGTAPVLRTMINSTELTDVSHHAANVATTTHVSHHAANV